MGIDRNGLDVKFYWYREKPALLVCFRDTYLCELFSNDKNSLSLWFSVLPPTLHPQPGLCSEVLQHHPFCLLLPSHKPFCCAASYTGASCKATIFRTIFHDCSLPEDKPLLTDFSDSQAEQSRTVGHSG